MRRVTRSTCIPISAASSRWQQHSSRADPLKATMEKRDGGGSNNNNATLWGISVINKHINLINNHLQIISMSHKRTQSW